MMAGYCTTIITGLWKCNVYLDQHSQLYRTPKRQTFSTIELFCRLTAKTLNLFASQVTLETSNEMHIVGTKHFNLNVCLVWSYVFSWIENLMNSFVYFLFCLYVAIIYQHINQQLQPFLVIHTTFKVNIKLHWGLILLK